jgi:uracil-DNA glycosylase
MHRNLSESWKNILSAEFDKPYFKELTYFVNKEYSNYQCFPKRDEIFSAFDCCSFKDLKVVIIGQDPYHDKNQANGLCFSVKDGIKHPPSLKNIFKEMASDLNIEIPQSGNLKKWSRQGVLLLNATLTVRAHEAGSHQKKVGKLLQMWLLSKFLKKKKILFFYFGENLRGVK